MFSKIPAAVHESRKLCTALPAELFCSYGKAAPFPRLPKINPCAVSFLCPVEHEQPGYEDYLAPLIQTSGLFF